MTDDDPRELADYEPGDARPLRSVARRRVMRIMVALGLTGLVLPGVLVTVGTQNLDRGCGMPHRGRLDRPGGHRRRRAVRARGG